MRFGSIAGFVEVLEDAHPFVLEDDAVQIGVRGDWVEIHDGLRWVACDGWIPVQLAELIRVDSGELPPEVGVVLITQAATEPGEGDGGDLVGLQPAACSSARPIPP
jgi:hypothetical protein